MMIDISSFKNHAGGGSSWVNLRVFRVMFLYPCGSSLCLCKKDPCQLVGQGLSGCPHKCILNDVSLVYVQWGRLDRRGIIVMEIKVRGLRVGWEWKGCSRYGRYFRDRVRGTRGEEGDEERQM